MYSIKAPAKLNIFLKITGTKPHPSGAIYHTLSSRFVRFESLFDEISFIPCECDCFTIEGCGDIDPKSNTIYKAYKLLNDHTGDLEFLDFFYHHKVVVTKRIPQGAGLGGGSSDAASFLLLAKEVCNLLISNQQLLEIGAQIGADVPFFLSGYPSANVSGFGEIIEPFEEEPVEFELFLPPISCSTPKVYSAYKALNLPYSKEPKELLMLGSKEIVQNSHSPQELNDLYQGALNICDKLAAYAPKGYLFSGSGSSFFKIKE